MAEGKQRVYALNICAYRKPDMDETAYHQYISEKHAPHVKELLIKKKILSYTVVSPIYSSRWWGQTVRLLSGYTNFSNTTLLRPRK
jgi:hypothetical protein